MTALVVAVWLVGHVLLATADTGAFDAGGGSSTSASYRVLASLGVISGDSVGGSVSNSSGGGTVTQPAMKTLTLNAVPLSVNEGNTSQLSGTATMDDDSVSVLASGEITWGGVSYPFQSLDSNGVLTAVAHVYSVASGTVNGSYLGVPGSTSVQVNGPHVGSGIPDSWFAQYFGMPPNPNAAPTADPTGCGQNNLFKYIAGLDPTNATSRFLLRIVSVAGQPNQKQLVFSPRWNDRIYTPLYRTNLVGGADWTNLVTSTVNDNGTERTVTDTNATDNARFYRIQITYP